jgi:hypothetical protein
MHESEHPIEHHSPEEGFDRSDPKTGAIWAFAVGSVLILVVTIWSLQQYFEKIWNDAVYQKVLTAPSEVLKSVRGRDDWDLTHYMYLNKDKGQVRIPLDQARELFLKEVASGKPFYPGKATVPKKEEPDATGAAPTSGPAPEGEKK